MRGRRAVAAGLALAAVAAAASPARSHSGGSTGYASIAIGQRSVRYSLTLWPSALPPAMAEELRWARAGRAPSQGRLLGFLQAKVTLIAQERRCEAGPGFLRPPPPQGESVTLVVDFACADPVRDLLIRDDLFDVLGADYHTLARIEAPGFSGQFAFTPETRETRVAVGGAGGGGWFSLAKIITAFTLAHSVTLALAVLNLVVLPDRLVEAVIALSIAFVAAENLFLSPVVSRRWLVSFCFGLVHGFGFSAALRELGLPSHGLLLSLFGFNAM